MACDCIGLTNKALAEKNCHLAVWLFFDGGPVRVTIPTTLNEKRRGQKAPTMVPDFCPFCGVRYVPDPEAVIAATDRAATGEGGQP